MRIRSKAQIYVVTFLTTSIALAIVLPTIMLLYPREDWLWELSISGVLTTTISVSMVFLFAQKLYENHLLQDELQRLVYRDRLTDVATRDFFFERMEQDPAAYGVSLMVDIDHFKSVNDTYGHLAGDQVICKVGEILRRNTRELDIVCRFGGEEFIIFLHQASSENGLIFAERIRKNIADSLFEFEDFHISVTVSIGGSLKEKYDDIMISIKEADEALYRAKQLGRNRTIVSWLTAGNALAVQ